MSRLWGKIHKGCRFVNRWFYCGWNCPVVGAFLGSHVAVIVAVIVVVDDVVDDDDDAICVHTL